MSVCSQATLVTQFSVPDCVPGVSYGCGKDGRLWTRHGCRGHFACSAAPTAGTIRCGAYQSIGGQNCSCGSTLASHTVKQQTDYYEKKSIRAWAVARNATRTRKARFVAAQFWIGLLTEPNAQAYARYLVPGGLRPLQRKGRRTFTKCPNGEWDSKDDTDSGAYCTSFFPVSQSCAAHIIGIGANWVFTRYATTHGCSVHAWDPTLELRKEHERGAKRTNRLAARAARPQNVTFHFAGLRGADRPTGAQSVNSYGSVNGADMLTLDAMVARTRGDGGILRVLTVDCEGCEWASFSQLAVDSAAAASLANVEYLVVELHVTPTLVAPTLAQFVTFFDFVFNTLGFRLWSLRSNDGFPRDQQVVDFLGIAGLPAGLCCYELGLVRGEALRRP
eukprot:CAMPEP_0119366080 /NCGR_PEP_ID=MMETSP1334-20130426/12958_1 /TAXON_ID=127549 /ORGANISM="Calcidiscus leptoporus, Strain RCC1130" /LENGTH=389 /DNA_ID=CAMNT_0007382199 /DNA_START=127 /DNA_END=1292 /DNA_ORIENTATION=+